MEKIITIILFLCVAAAADVTITGKKMELRPRQNLVIFTEGAVVTHSSFTLKANKIVRDNASKEIKAFGGVELNSTNYFLSGETADYSISQNSGAVFGTPSYGRFVSEKGETGQLTAQKIYYTMERLSAMDDAVLNYSDAKIISSLICYDSTEKKMSAEPLTRLTFDDLKYTCEFSAGKMIFLQQTRLVKLTDGVTGTVVFKKTGK